MAFAKDLTGKTFFRLTVQGRSSVNTNDGKPRWVCHCECGNTTTVAGSNLSAGAVKSCGCWRKENVGDRNRTHGLSGTPEYDAWASMKKRCYSSSSHNYQNYGGRGITVCDRWLDSFENFYDDLGPKPSPEHSVERRENDLGYAPNNCYWGTQIEQANNRRSNTMHEYEGETYTVSQLARKFNIDYELLLRRLQNRSSVEEAINFKDKRYPT